MRNLKSGYEGLSKKNESLLIAVLILTVVTFSTFTLNVYAATKDEGNVHGTVVDLDGEILGDVKLSIFTESGDVATDYTNRNGYFRLALETGRYTIKFEKEGYAPLMKEIEVTSEYIDHGPEHDEVKMGKISLEDVLKISASVLSRVVSPGDTVLLPFTVTNLGEEPEDLQFLVISPLSWDTSILVSSGEVKRVVLDSGSLDLDLEVTVPLTATEVSNITLTADGTINATIGFTIHPTKTQKRELVTESTFLSISEELGRKIYFPLKITNEGEVDEVVDLTGVAPSGWSVSFVTGSDMAVRSLYLTSGKSETLTIEVDPSEDAVVGDYIVVVDAVTEDEMLRDSLELEVNLRQATSDVEIISTFTDVTVEAGKDIDFPIAIWNKGETDALFLLTVLSVPENWKTVFTSEDIEISSVLVTAGESITLQLEVTPPKAVETGEYPIIVYTGSDDGLIMKQIDFRVSVVGAHELELELSTLYKTLTIGDSVEFTVEISNTGNSPITTLYLDISVPEEWKVTATPKLVSTLTPKDSVTFTVVADTPADTVAGDYLLTVQAMSDQTESEEVDLRATAKASTSWGYIGIGLAGIAVVGLIIAFTRFKRR
jgi:uncharacterized membrane protein